MNPSRSSAAPPRPKDPRRFGNFAIWSTATQSGFAVEMTLGRRKVPCSRLRCGQIRVSVLLFAQWFQVSFSVVFFGLEEKVLVKKVGVPCDARRHVAPQVLIHAASRTRTMDGPTDAEKLPVTVRAVGVISTLADRVVERRSLRPRDDRAGGRRFNFPVFQPFPRGSIRSISGLQRDEGDADARCRPIS